jgi:predicted O-methyltransferase YrrM
LIAARWFARHQIQADLIYIDASHDEDDVYADLTHYWKLLRPGGIMLGDDWSDHWYGVICAVNRFAKEQQLPLKIVKPKWLSQKPL